MDKKEAKSNNHLVDTKGLAQLMGLKESWIRRNMQVIPHVRFGHLVRFDPAEVREAFKKDVNENQLD